jgi:hypothetical protein
MATPLRLRSLAYAALTTLVAQAAAAQTAPRPGDRIRVHVSGAAPVEGRLVRLDADQVVFRVEGRERSAAMDGTTRVELRRTRTHGRTGAVLGALAGAAVGIAAPLDGDVPCSGWGCTGMIDADDARIGLVVGGLLLGAALGAILGVTIRTEIWEPIGPGSMPPIGPAVPRPPPFGPPALSIGVRLRM